MWRLGRTRDSRQSTATRGGSAATEADLAEAFARVSELEAERDRLIDDRREVRHLVDTAIWVIATAATIGLMAGLLTSLYLSSSAVAWAGIGAGALGIVAGSIGTYRLNDAERWKRNRQTLSDNTLVIWVSIATAVLIGMGFFALELLTA